MIKKVRCYNYERLLTMLDIKKHSEKHSDFINIITSYECFIFQPPYIKATSRPTRRPEYYISSCKELDEYVAPYQTIARLKDTFVAKIQYRECVIEGEVKISEKGNLGTTIGLFTFY